MENTKCIGQLFLNHSKIRGFSQDNGKKSRCVIFKKSFDLIIYLPKYSTFIITFKLLKSFQNYLNSKNLCLTLCYFVG